MAIRRGTDDRSAVEHRPDALLRTASVAKVFVLMELADRITAGTLDAGQVIDRRDSSPVHDSGIWHAMRVDALPLGDLAVLVGALSDNWATNALLGVCGLERVRALAARVAPGGSTLHDFVRDERPGDVPATLSEGCAADWVAIMQRLHLADADAPGPVLGWLAHDADLSMVAGALDLDPLAHDATDLGLRLRHKTGTDAGVRADVGVISSASDVMSYAALCNWPAADTGPHTRRAVLTAMRGIGDALRSGLTGTG